MSDSRSWRLPEAGQTRTEPSLPELTNCLPSDENATDQTSSLWPNSVSCSFQVSVFQSLIVWSPLAEARNFPSGEKAKLAIKPRCPSRVAILLLVAESQTRIRG